MKSEYVLIHAAPIKHYGIKGQKKGVRRFQLDNGELTAAGKARYGVGTSNPATDGGHKGGYFTGDTGGTMKRMKDYLLRNTNYRMDDASTAAGVDGRALVGAYGKNVGKTRSSAPSVPAVDSKTPWGKRASAVASTPASTPTTKKETKDNLGQNGGRPYSTPYTQTVASGRKKNVTGSTLGASANKSSGINAAKASDSAYATMAKAIDPVEKANAKVEAQRKKQEEVDIKRNNAIESAAYNSQSKFGEPKSKHEIGSGTVSAVSKAARTISSKPKDNTPKSKTSDDSAKNKNTSKTETKVASKNEKQKDSYTPASNNYVENPKSKIDNGAVDTLKKKDLVKIKSGKNTRK